MSVPLLPAATAAAFGSPGSVTFLVSAVRVLWLLLIRLKASPSNLAWQEFVCRPIVGFSQIIFCIYDNDRKLVLVSVIAPKGQVSSSVPHSIAEPLLAPFCSGRDTPSRAAPGVNRCPEGGAPRARPAAGACAPLSPGRVFLWPAESLRASRPAPCVSHGPRAGVSPALQPTENPLSSADSP